MRHIHTSIVSRHLATRGNNKILRTPPPHISSSEEIFPRLTPRTLAQLRINTTSALLQLTTDIAVGFNERKPPDRTICVAVDLSAAFDTVCHNNLLSKINRSQLPPATARWISCYLRGRQAKTCFRRVKSTSRKVNTGVPQGSKLSPSLFSFYIADMPIPTEPVKRVCYADDLTVWASRVNIPDLEVSINNYLEEITAYLKDNSLLISAPKSSVTLLTPDTHQAKIHPRICIENSHLPLVKCPSILGVYLDPSLSFNKHSQYVAERVSSRNNILKAFFLEGRILFR